MTGLEFMESINYVDDDLVFEAENWVRSNASKKRYMFGAAIVAACLYLTIGLSTNYAQWGNHLAEKDELNGCLIPGGNEIYPTIMVDDILYEWRFGVALIDELPVGSIYYGRIKHTNGTTPENNCELVSVFSASGRIFVDPNKDLIYLELSTDWLEKQLVIFEPRSTSDRYQMEVRLQNESGNFN